MKKLLFLALITMIISTIIFAGCGEKTTTTSTPKPTTSAPAPTTTSAPQPTQTTSAPPLTTTSVAPMPAVGEYGGTLRIIYNAAPRILGGSVEQGPFDLFVLLGGVEK
jgi:PBP1b-binding outer membrane lipoprotein LpoB